MDAALPQKFPFILDRNLAKANCTRYSSDIVVLAPLIYSIYSFSFLSCTCLAQPSLHSYHGTQDVPALAPEDSLLLASVR